ncbi:hypothetical protein M3M33_16675, partial [Loigolactobacillus coryniformis]|uniref:hypothetical protein n=1 Tax=Loigolactobacillus coryniformis TaxID=1610 RepID=UPI00201B2AC6
SNMFDNLKDIVTGENVDRDKAAQTVTKIIASNLIFTVMTQFLTQYAMEFLDDDDDKALDEFTKSWSSITTASGFKDSVI